MMTKHYIIITHVVVGFFAFIFSGLLGADRDKPGEAVALAVFWPFVFAAYVLGGIDSLRCYIIDWNEQRKLDKTKLRIDSEPIDPAPSVRIQTETSYREMDCGHCGHTVAPKQSKS